MNVNLIEMECPECHILFWITENHKARLVKSKETYFCPNGHTACFVGKSNKELLIEEKERHKETYNYYENELANFKGLKKELRICKGQITKLKKKKGVS